MKKEISIASEFMGSLLDEDQVCSCHSCVSAIKNTSKENISTVAAAAATAGNGKEMKCLKDSGKICFLEAIQNLLFEKFVNHWHPAIPEQGQAYRAIYINYKLGMNMGFYVFV